MPSAVLQSRISAFEALASPLPTSPPPAAPRMLSPPVAQCMLDAPISPEAHRFTPIEPTPSGSSSSSSSSSSAPSSSQSAPPNGQAERNSSLIDLGDWVVENGPSPQSHSSADVSASTSTSHLSQKMPPPPPPARRVQAVNAPSPRPTPGSGAPQSPPLIAFHAPPKPSLPPRKPSQSSLRSASVSTVPTTPAMPAAVDMTSPRPTAPALPQRHVSDSLTLQPSALYAGRGHAQASSVSSFHSVSLSSDGGDPATPSSPSFPSSSQPTPTRERAMEREHERDADTSSLDSYERLSASSVLSVSPTAVRGPLSNWSSQGQKKPEPPRLPQRPRAPPLSASSSVTSSSGQPPSATTYAPYVSRRAPPPPPPLARSPHPPSSSRTSATSGSDRSSILSNMTSTSRTSDASSMTGMTLGTSKMGGMGAMAPMNAAVASKLSRPTPIPVAARKRYEAVFTVNVVQCRKTIAGKRRQNGWRGFSVDLVGEVGKEGEETVGQDARLDGPVVAGVWSRSRLGKEKLRQIWMECDIAGQGSVDREGFVRGMWRIDEELSRAQTARQAVGAGRSVKRAASKRSLR